MKKFYIHNGTDQLGPFDLDELKSKNISKETPIWFEGLNEWTTAGQIDDLKTLFTAIPPPFNSKSTLPPPISKIEKKQTVVNSSPNLKKNKAVKYILSISILLILIAVGLFIINENSKNSGNSGSSSRSSADSYNSENEEQTYEEPTYEEKVLTVEQTEKSNPTSFLAAGGTYNENFWGDKIKVHCKIENRATVAVYKDVVVKVSYYSKTKTLLGSKKYTIYESFPPNMSKSIELRIDNYKDVNSIGWDVISANSY